MDLKCKAKKLSLLYSTESACEQRIALYKKQSTVYIETDSVSRNWQNNHMKPANCKQNRLHISMFWCPLASSLQGSFKRHFYFQSPWREISKFVLRRFCCAGYILQCICASMCACEANYIGSMIKNYFFNLNVPKWSVLGQVKGQNWQYRQSYQHFWKVCG